MKHFYRIISAMMFLSLLLSIGVMAHAQSIGNVPKNIDGSIDDSIVIQAFQSYMETIENLPTTEEGNQEFVRSFFDNLPSNEYGDIVIKKGDGSIADSQEIEEISQQCINLLKRKKSKSQNNRTNLHRNKNPSLYCIGRLEFK